MATIATYASRSAAFSAYYSGATSNGTPVTPTLQYVSDGTAIAVEFESYLSNPYYDRVTVQVSAEGAPKTTVKTASWQHTNTSGNSSYSDNTLGTSNITIHRNFVLDANENIVVPLIGTGNNGTVQGAIYFVKFTKPTEGWRAWALGSSSTLTTSITGGHSTVGINGATAYAYGMKACWYTASGHIVVLTGFQSTPTTYFGYIVYNASTLAYVSFTGFGVASATGASIISAVQFGKTSQGGGIWYNQGTAATTDLAKFNIWNVSSSGVLTATDRGKLFGLTLDSYTTAMQYVHRVNSAYYGADKIVSIARPSGGSNFYLRVDQISQTSTSISSLQSDSTYASTPSGSYSSGGASTIGVILQPFYEEGFVRIWSVADSGGSFGYLDAFINPTTNAITWATASVSVASFGFAAGGTYSQFGTPTFNRHQDVVIPSGATITSVWDNTLITLPTGAAWANTTTGPTAASFTSPTVSSLNLQGGLKLQITYTGASGGHGFAWSGRNFHQSAPFGYQLKRTLSGTDTYYNATTQTFSTSAVTNTSTAATLAVDIPASAGFATSGTYAFSVAIVDANGIASPFGTTDSITSTTAAATTTPTATRFIRKTLANATLAHEYTFNNRALVNKINITNAGSGGSTIAVQIGGVYLVAPVSLPSGGTLTVDTSQVVDANDRLMLTSSNTATDIYISGTEGI